VPLLTTLSSLPLKVPKIEVLPQYQSLNQCINEIYLKLDHQIAKQRINKSEKGTAVVRIYRLTDM
jgi:hypothetical protein